MPAKGGVTQGTLAVIGGGIIGLAVARRAALDGWTVRVHRATTRARRGSRAGCSPRTARAGPARSACFSWGWRRWRCGTGFLDGLPADVVTARESLVVAVDRADAADLKTVGEWLAAQGQPVTLTSSARDVEPLLAQGIRHGFVAETEFAVDNRAVVEALAAHCERLGVQWAPPMTNLSESRGRRRSRSSPTASTRPRCGPGCRSGR